MAFNLRKVLTTVPVMLLMFDALPSGLGKCSDLYWIGILPKDGSEG